MIIQLVTPAAARPVRTDACGIAEVVQLAVIKDRLVGAAMALATAMRIRTRAPVTAVRQQNIVAMAAAMAAKIHTVVLPIAGSLRQ
jgi:hypothetical protein